MQVLIEVNKKRKEKKAQALECSNRAVGVAENFSEIMSNQCVPFNRNHTDVIVR